jgi:hypothetical protein
MRGIKTGFEIVPLSEVPAKKVPAEKDKLASLFKQVESCRVQEQLSATGATAIRD